LKMDGILNIDKPAGMTSHDVVARLRWILGQKKIGHTGTLDPDATGVLVLCLGKATKIIQFLQEDEKEYEGTITFGIATDTLDASGEVLEISETVHIEPDDVKNALKSFTGDIDQIPPMVSAVRIQGKRLYEIARKGETIERQPRRVHIYKIEMLKFYREAAEGNFRSSGDADLSQLFTKMDFRVLCSKGTYVRALARDIGGALGCGAHISRLVRTKSGICYLRDSVSLDEIAADPQIASRSIRSMGDMLSFMPGVIVTDSARKRFLNGIPPTVAEVVSYENEFESSDLIRIRDRAGTLLGIGEATESHKPSVALKPQTLICKLVKVLS